MQAFVAGAFAAALAAAAAEPEGEPEPVLEAEPAAVRSFAVEQESDEEECEGSEFDTQVRPSCSLAASAMRAWPCALARGLACGPGCWTL